MSLLMVFIVPVVIAAIGLLPQISIDVDAVISSSAFEYVRAALYFVPVNTVLIISTIILAFWVWRMIVSFVKAVWDLLPVA